MSAAAPPSDPWAAASPAFGTLAEGLSLDVLQPQPGFGDQQQAANQMQQLLMAGHRLEALRQASPLAGLLAASIVEITVWKGTPQHDVMLSCLCGLV